MIMSMLKLSFITFHFVIQGATRLDVSQFRTQTITNVFLQFILDRITNSFSHCWEYEHIATQISLPPDPMFITLPLVRMFVFLQALS